ncbi:unnamed protein product [Penicillium roqueforti FM164]|uniref:Uncharacterized protein n=1 Tax=Penicillium roqueforti (strain FM164) TaxID=1365484 RepID=W6QUS3_PENRF|nr:unnamed protein product [Penicillium roqueforti FM164]
MPESVITVILTIYQKYMDKRWWRPTPTGLGSVQSERGAGKESVCPRGTE